MRRTGGMRYAAGWVIRSISKKISKSTGQLKDDLMIGVGDLFDVDNDEFQESSEWVDTVNCRGLTRINNITFQLFLIMEKGLRRIVSAPSESHNPEKCVEELMSDNDVHCIWMLVSIDWTEACAETLLQMIGTEWTKIQGFSYASAYVEKLKNQKKKTTQKTERLRKQLQPVQSSRSAKKKKQIKTMTWMTVIGIGFVPTNNISK